MSVELMSLIIIGGLLILLFAGTEIYAAMGIMGAVGLVFFAVRGLTQFPHFAWNALNSFTLTAMPLFIFMGAMFATSGILRDLFQGANKWLGRLPAGLACSVLAANAVFGAMSGSSTAACATFGKIAYPEMERLGYQPKLTLGTLAMGSTLSVLIPPSYILVFYGIWMDISITQLFAAGLIPGIIFASFLMITAIGWVKLNPHAVLKPPKITWREKLLGLLKIAPSIVVVVGVLGTVFMGIMTPTEAASMGAFLSIVMAVAYRKFTFTGLMQSGMLAARISAMVGLLMVSGMVLSQIFQYIGFTEFVKDFMLGLPLGKYGIIVIISVMYLIMGMFVSSISMLILTAPFIGPIVSELGFSLLWFAIVFVLLCEIGMVTPPYGMNLFVLHGVVPQHSIITIALGSLPFIPAALVVVALVVAFPQLALWFPALL